MKNRVLRYEVRVTFANEGPGGGITEFRNPDYRFETLAQADACIDRLGQQARGCGFVVAKVYVREW